MDEAIVRKLIDFFAQRNHHLQSYVDDILYVPERNERVEYYERVIGVESVAVGWDGLRQRAQGVTKLLSISFDRDELTDDMNAVRENFGDLLEVTHSNIRFAEFMSKGVTKAGAIKILADKFGVDIADVLAIGDSENDLPMLKAAGVGVAMGNAQENVKAACKYVTDTCEHDGFAKAVRDYVLSRAWTPHFEAATDGGFRRV